MTGWDILGKDIDWGWTLANESCEKWAVSQSEPATFQNRKGHSRDGLSHRRQFRWIMTSISFERLELLKEEYEYFEKVGSGKFGSVYRVICKTTGETSFCYSSQRWYDVVIIFMLKSKLNVFFSGAVFAAKHVQCRRASEKTRLVEEVDILKSLDHPNIMKLYR